MASFARPCPLIGTVEEQASIRKKVKEDYRFKDFVNVSPEILILYKIFFRVWRCPPENIISQENNLKFLRLIISDY